MASAFQQLVYNFSAKLCCFYSGKDCFCIFRIYTEKYFCHYFSSFLFFVVYIGRQPSVKAPSAPVSILWLPTFRFLFLFISFCSLFFFFLLPIFHLAPSSSNIPNFYFFRIFLRISARKTAPITGCCKFSCAVFS